MGKWVDYYSVLQVHCDAEPEVIQGAYRRLCKKYHPDISRESASNERITLINEAYSVLSDERKRLVFHGEWKIRNAAASPAGRAARAAERPRNPFEDGTPEARDCVEKYFRHIAGRGFREAFSLISEADKRRTSYGMFIEWQESVAQLYEIGRFSVRLFKRREMKAAPTRRFTAEEYTVTVVEKNLNTNMVTEYSLNKTVVLENGVWKVYLGYRDLAPILQKFKFQASDSGGGLFGHLEHYNAVTDELTGLPNKKGFLEGADVEIYRNKRYGRRFSLGVFRPVIPDKVTDARHYDQIIKFIGYILNNTKREVDSAAHIGGGIFAVLFSETDGRLGAQAARRLVKRIRHDVGSCFDIDVDMRFSVLEYNGETVGSMLSAAASEADPARGRPARKGVGG